MSYYQFEMLYSAQKWLQPAFVKTNSSGIITSLSNTFDPTYGEALQKINGLAIPGFCNGHSHAFQYAMGGLTEYLPQLGVHDDFWSWRETMYKVALSLNPDQMEAIAAMVYGEMLRFGYTSVVEFHYLHQNQDGNSYQEPAELSLRLMNAANKAGIKLLLVPVLYQQGNFKTPPFPRQRRFILPTMDSYLKLVETCRSKAPTYQDCSIGTGIHSLRAVDPKAAQELFNLKDPAPRHLHIAEQRREVEEATRHLGQSPTQWLLDSVDLDSRYFLVHGTHSTPGEVEMLANRGANLVLCPSTEGNLGDGFFPLLPFLKDSSKGSFLLGTDSQINLNPLEDLRWLDYVQRLRVEKRNPVCKMGGDESATVLWQSLQRARIAAGDPNSLMVGDCLDALVINTDHPLFFGKPSDHWPSVLVYSGDPSVFEGTMRRGEWIVRHGKHRHFNTLATTYKKTMEQLLF